MRKVFPNTDNFIDSVAISVFCAVKVHERDPVPTVLADLYHTPHMRHDKGNELMIYCIPFLHLWLASHLYKDVHMIKIMTSHDWSQKLRSLTKKSISCPDFLLQIVHP